MSEETLNNVSRELIPREDFLQVINQLFKQRIDAAVQAKQK